MEYLVYPDVAEQQGAIVEAGSERDAVEEYRRKVGIFNRYFLEGVYNPIINSGWISDHYADHLDYDGRIPWRQVSEDEIEEAYAKPIRAFKDHPEYERRFRDMIEGLPDNYDPTDLNQLREAANEFPFPEDMLLLMKRAQPAGPDHYVVIPVDSLRQRGKKGPSFKGDFDPRP